MPRNRRKVSALGTLINDLFIPYRVPSPEPLPEQAYLGT